eukprot:764342-Hanusia_phi.AAC.1
MLDLNQKFLYGIPMFYHVGKGFLGQLAAKLRFVEMLEGEKVLQYGELCDTLYIVFSGQCALLNARGKLIVKLERGDFFGEFEVLQPKVQDYDVVVMQQSQLSYVTKADLDEVSRKEGRWSGTREGRRRRRREEERRSEGGGGGGRREERGGAKEEEEGGGGERRRREEEEEEEGPEGEGQIGRPSDEGRGGRRGRERRTGDGEEEDDGGYQVLLDYPMLERKLREVANKSKSVYSYVGSAFFSDRTKEDLVIGRKEGVGKNKNMKELKDAKANKQGSLSDIYSYVDATMSENDAALRWIILSSRILRAINSEDSCNRLMNRLVHFSYSMYGVNNPKHVDEDADNVGDDQSDISECSIESHEDMLVPRLLGEKLGVDLGTVEGNWGLRQEEEQLGEPVEEEEKKKGAPDKRTQNSLSEILK